ncbi:MAG: LuxR family transcriptional regulator [Eggerthellaceae bacterium]|nr:LuxR family transcriptional regulator [Eggerthellaceae bacterium]
MAVINVCRLLGVAEMAPYFAGVLLLCVGFIALAVAWFHHLASLPRNCVVPLVLAAFAISHASCLVDMLPRDVAAFASMIYPVCSVAAFYVCACAKEASCSPDAAYESDAPAAGKPDGYFRKMRALVLILIVAELACGAFLRSRWAHGGIGYDPTANTAFIYLVSAAIGVLFFLVVRKSCSAAEASLVIGVTGMVSFILATVVFALLPASVLAPLVTGMYSALLVYLMALVALWPSDGDCSSIASAGAFVLLYGSISGLTSTAIPLLLSFRGFMPDIHLALVGVVAGLTISLGVCLALFATVVIYRDSYLDALARAGLTETNRGGSPNIGVKDGAAEENHLDEQAMDALARAFDLTRREQETASLIARGFTAKRVADELCLTLSTVQSYSKSIYRKMGIHKKDELIELVAEARKDPLAREAIEKDEPRTR